MTDKVYGQFTLYEVTQELVEAQRACRIKAIIDAELEAIEALLGNISLIGVGFSEKD